MHLLSHISHISQVFRRRSIWAAFLLAFALCGISPAGRAQILYDSNTGSDFTSNSTLSNAGWTDVAGSIYNASGGTVTGTPDSTHSGQQFYYDFLLHDGTNVSEIAVDFQGNQVAKSYQAIMARVSGTAPSKQGYFCQFDPSLSTENNQQQTLYIAKLKTDGTIVGLTSSQKSANPRSVFAFDTTHNYRLWERITNISGATAVRIEAKVVDLSTGFAICHVVAVDSTSPITTDGQVGITIWRNGGTGTTRLTRIQLGASHLLNAAGTLEPTAPLRVQVVCSGNSITKGDNAGLNPLVDSYPAQLQGLLGAGFVVRNEGHDGQDIREISDPTWNDGASVTAGTGSVNKVDAWFNSDDYAANVLVFMEGTNQLAHWSHPDLGAAGQYYYAGYTFTGADSSTYAGDSHVTSGALIGQAALDYYTAKCVPNAAEELYNLFLGYAQARQAVGWSVVAVTEPYTWASPTLYDNGMDPWQDGQRQAFNSLLRTNRSKFQGFVDWAITAPVDSSAHALADTANGTANGAQYNSDTVHYTHAGYGNFAAAIRPGVLAALPSPYAVKRKIQ